MKPTAIALVSLLALLSKVGAREIDYCYAYEPDPYLLMATKTAYQFVYGKARLQSVPNCMPVQIWMVARHGARYPGLKKITQLSTLPKLRDQIIYNHETRGYGRLCNNDLENLKNWDKNRYFDESKANLLTPQGQQDAQLLAKRLQSEFPEILRFDPQNINYQNYKFEATDTQRAQTTMQAFSLGLFNNSVPTSINDTLLRTYKKCPIWEKSLADDRIHDEADKFMAEPDYENLIQNVSQRLGFAHKINNDSIRLMYDMCRYEKAIELNNLPVWCAIFSKEELKVLEYLEDLKYYYESGPGREINEKLGCPLLQDMFNHFTTLEQGNFESEPKGIFYFSHTVTVQTLLTALGIAKDSTPLLASNYHSMERRSFRTSILGSFGSNLIAVFYSCSEPQSPNKVMFYLNEIPVLMEGCSVGLCDYTYLKEKFGDRASKCNLDFCNNANAAPNIVDRRGIAFVTIVAVVIFRSFLTL